MSRQRFGVRLSSAALDFYGTCEETHEAAFHQWQERKARPLRLHPGKRCEKIHFVKIFPRTFLRNSYGDL